MDTQKIGVTTVRLVLTLVGALLVLYPVFGTLSLFSPEFFGPRLYTILSAIVAIVVAFWSIRKADSVEQLWRFVFSIYGLLIIQWLIFEIIPMVLGLKTVQVITSGPVPSLIRLVGIYIAAYYLVYHFGFDRMKEAVVSRG